MADISSILLHGSAQSVSAAIAAGAFTSVDATRWYLQRITEHRELNAVRSISPLALDQAAQADAELAAGRCRGPLHGVPYLIKDNVFTADGCSASAGALALADFVPQ